MEQMQKRWTTEVDKMKSIQREIQKNGAHRQQLEAQIRENKAVLTEIEPLAKENGDGKVFKLIGPALVPQDASEAKQTVDKRLQYIEAEAKRIDGLIADGEKKQNAQREVLSKLQQQAQQAQVKQAVKQ